MTLTIEVDDDKALDELKTFLEEKKEMRLMNENTRNTVAILPEPTVQNEMTDEERRAILRSLRGSLNMSPERLKEYEAFLYEIRNEWE